MSTLQIVIDEGSFRRALLSLAPEIRSAFLAQLHGVAGMPSEVSSDAPEEETEAEETLSFPLTVEQARMLVEGLGDSGLAHVLRRMVDNARSDVGTIDWSEIKQILDIQNWAQFAQGPMSGLHRRLRKITGDRKAILLWEGEGWVDDGKGDYSAGTVAINGQAVRSLRTIYGLRAGANRN